MSFIINDQFAHFAIRCWFRILYTRLHCDFIGSSWKKKIKHPCRAIQAHDMTIIVLLSIEAV